MTDKTATNVKLHNIHIVVWDVPSTIECGKAFSIKLGVKCDRECGSDGWLLKISDHEGNELTSATLSDEPWPDTTALYYAEVELNAPDTEGLYAWKSKVAVAELEIPHSESRTDFNVRAVPPAECVLTVEAIDLESQTPVEGAKVVVHPYRTFTDERGLAEVRVPKGEYRLFVSGKNYFPFRSDIEVTSDMTIRAELAVDQELTDADIYS